MWKLDSGPMLDVKMSVEVIWSFTLLDFSNYLMYKYIWTLSFLKLVFEIRSKSFNTKVYHIKVVGCVVGCIA
jgi:hypothetical protein